MDAETVKTLLDINQNFYSQFSAEFSGSRSGERMNIAPFREYLTDELRLLDAGCGNGRLAEALARAGLSPDYWGVDGSAELVAYAQQNAVRQNLRAQFRVADLTAPHWSESVRAAAPFDLVISLAVVHHIPSFELRTQLVREIHALLKPRGLVVMSNWQFLNNERLRKKIVPWENVNLDAAKLDTNDYLLDWKRGGVGYRYVHNLEKTEVERLAHACGFHVVKQFLADNEMNLYSILERAEPNSPL